MRALLFLLHAAVELQMGLILKLKHKITSPSLTFIFEARFRPESQIYLVGQDTAFIRFYAAAYEAFFSSFSAACNQGWLTFFISLHYYQKV